VTTDNVKVIGIAWYRRADYPAIREVMEDAYVLPENYDAWSRLAKSVVRAEEANGARIVKAIIVPQDFVGWCVIRRQNANVEARTLFVNETIAAALARRSAPSDVAPVERKASKKADRKGYPRVSSYAPVLAT